jgi:transcriptional regulator with XRE-family HTH domain
MDFAERLKRVRRGRGLSQSGLAERARLPVDDVQNWEQGRRTPRLEGLVKLARALGVSLDDLVLRKGGKR